LNNHLMLTQSSSPSAKKSKNKILESPSLLNPRKSISKMLVPSIARN